MATRGKPLPEGDRRRLLAILETSSVREAARLVGVAVRTAQRIKTEADKQEEKR